MANDARNDYPLSETVLEPDDSGIRIRLNDALCTEGVEIMYREHVPLIRQHCLESEDGLKNMLHFVLATIQQGLSTVPAIIVLTVSVGTCAMSAAGSLNALLDKALAFASKENYYISTWVNNDTCYVDIKRVLQSRQVAQVLSRQLGNLTYYDIAAGKSVILKDNV